jgi:hypothetical protein
LLDLGSAAERAPEISDSRTFTIRRTRTELALRQAERR